MRAVSRVAFVGWFLVSAGGCAAVTGLDGISEQDCAPDCGDAHSTKDVTADVPQGQDSSIPETSPPGETGTPEASGDDGPDTMDTSMPPVDAHEASTKDGGMDSAMESGMDAPIDAPKETTVPDSACGPTNTTQNCGACGQACTSPNAGTKSSGCGGSACLYSCNTGYLDCNASVGYDPDGCECDVTAATAATCCGNACPTKHGDGLTGGNPNFYDCFSTGTYNAQLAADACATYTGNSALCGTPGECTNAADAGTGDFVVCGQITSNGACPCWEYQGPNTGKVTVGSGVNLTACICPGSTGPGITTTSYQ